MTLSGSIKLNQGTKTAMKAITDKIDIGEAATIIESKLCLVRHALIYGAEELTMDEKHGLAFVIEDVMGLTADVLEYAQDAENYFFQKNNPTCYGSINAKGTNIYQSTGDIHVHNMDKKK